MKINYVAKVVLIIFAPLLYAIAIFLFEFFVPGEVGVKWLTNLTWGIFKLTSISRAFRSTNDVGFLYYWVFWMINSIIALAIATVVLRYSQQKRFSYPAFSKQTNRNSIIVTIVFLFFYFGLTGIYSQNSVGSQAWFPANLKGIIIYILMFEGFCLLALASFFKMVSYFDLIVGKYWRTSP
jgi:hypothetical protein